MTEIKKSKNPFINLANEAKKNNTQKMYGKTSTIQKAPKPSKGFGSTTVVKRSGRGG
jgi:hypothetical protein